VSEPVYSRAPDVVWRLGPDRVLVRRIGGRGEAAAAELIGGAAVAWVALDEPATRSELRTRLSEGLMLGAEIGAIDQLLSAGWAELRTKS
jgi:hypothetical protein